MPAIISPFSNISHLRKNDKVHVALSGTSNSIYLNGFSDGLRNHPAVSQFRNMSHGASGTVSAAFHLRNFYLTNFQYVFIEYSVNETGYLADGSEKIENTYRQIASMIDSAAQQGCVPVLINFPKLQSLGQKTPMMRMFEQEFISLGVAVFDVQEWVEVQGRTRGIDMKSFFQDPFHLKRELAYELGNVIIDTVEEARSANAISSVVNKTEAEFGTINFLPADALISSGSGMISRSSRLLQANFLPLAPGQAVTIPAPKDGKRYVVRGASFNIARSIGRLTTEQGEVIADVLRTHRTGMTSDLYLVNVPSPMHEIILSKAKTFFCEDLMSRENGDPVGFELAGLIIHDKDELQPLHVVIVNQSSRHLHENISSKNRIRLNEVCDRILLGTMGSAEAVGSSDGLQKSQHSMVPGYKQPSEQNGFKKINNGKDRVSSDADKAWTFYESQQKLKQFYPREAISRISHNSEIGASGIAFGRRHLAVKSASENAVDYQIMWSTRAQFIGSPILRFGGVVVTPSPSSGLAIYPYPVDAVPAAETDGVLNVTIFAGQSLSLWSCSGGPKGQAWSSTLEWESKVVDPRILMLKGGIINPGIASGKVREPRAQGILVPARDKLYGSTPEIDAGGVETGSEAFTSSSSPAIAHMIRRALGADGHRYGTHWMGVSIGAGAKPIEHFLPPLQGNMGGWFSDIFEPTLSNIVNASVDFSVRVAEVVFEHGEADSQSMTSDDYRNYLDFLVNSMSDTVGKATGQIRPPIFAQTQIGRVLLSTGASLTGRAPREVSDVSLAILEKGISQKGCDLNYICVGPRYDLTFAGISHLDHFGYLHSDERRAYAINEHERLQNLEPSSKWMPAHVVSAKLVGEQANEEITRHELHLKCHVPFPPLRLDFDLVPKKLGFGFSLEGGAKQPEIIGCRICAGGTTIVLELSDQWKGENLFVGVATKSPSSNQGWLTNDRTPKGDWEHIGLGCNIHDSAPWSSSATGRLLPNWLCSQYVEVNKQTE